MSKQLELVNQALSAVFLVELLIKLIGFGPTVYFKNSWNILDFLIVIVSLVDFVLTVATKSGVNNSVQVVRIFRIARILKLLRRFKVLRLFFYTFITSLPSLVSVGALLFLVIYMYAIMGMYLFASVRLQKNLNENANFQTVGNAMLTLFRVSTGDGWKEIMEDCARQYNLYHTCVWDQTYAEQQSDGIMGCGSQSMSYFYFISFMVLVTFILLNLFVAVVLENFNLNLTEDEAPISQETI
jgi:hypothetical protein